MSALPEPAQEKMGTTRLVVPSILNRALRLRTEAEALLNRHYASEAPEQLLGFVLAAVDRITADLQQVVQDEEARPTLTTDEFDRIVRRHGQLLVPLNAIMSFLDRSQVEETAAELVAPFRRLVSDTGLLPELDIVLQPVWSLNYAVLDVRRWVEKAMAAYPELVDKLPPSLVLLQFPKSEMSNVLLHCMVAHELGHNVYKRHGLADELLGKIRLDMPPLAQMIDDLVAKLMKRLAESLAAGQRPAQSQLSFEDWLPREQIRAEANRTITAAIQAWVEELACDALAIELLGVSYFLSFADFATSLLGFDESATTHPPARLRLRLMRSMLQSDLADAPQVLDEEAAPYLPGLREQLRKWNDALDATAAEAPESDQMLIARAAVESILSDIAETARSMVHRTRNRCYDGDSETICHQLRLMITCNEIFSENSDAKIADIDQIMRGAWAFALAGFPDWQSKYGLDDTKCTAKLSELVLKSAELVEIYKTLKEE